MLKTACPLLLCDHCWIDEHFLYPSIYLIILKYYQICIYMYAEIVGQTGMDSM